jgi:hypothetical protein
MKLSSAEEGAENAEVAIPQDLIEDVLFSGEGN